MMFKHSLKSIIRTPNKSLLFLFLLFVLTIFLNIGAGMYMSAHNMLLDADKPFTTVVELNYLGDLGGDEVKFYRNMNLDLVDFDFNKLEDHPNVKAVGMEKTAWAFIDGNTIKRSNLPLNNYAIVKIDSIKKYGDSLFQGIVNENFFGKKVREKAYIKINDMDEQGMPLNTDFKVDHEYLILGKAVKGISPMLILSPGITDLADNIPCIIDLTEHPDFFLSDEGKQIMKLQEAMTVVDNSLQVTAVSSLEASNPYYFNEILMKEGRIFSPLEYQEQMVEQKRSTSEFTSTSKSQSEGRNNEVILISEAIADFYKVKVGDKLPLKLHYNSSGIGLSDFLTDSNFAYEANYEVIGIFENKQDNKYIIYMPTASWLEQDIHSTSLTRYIVKNGTGAEFIEDNKNNILPNMEFTLYDQGYGEAVKPIIALKNSAVIIMVLGSLSAVAILILFSYLYVFKQKDTLKTMLLLGTGKKRTINYILFGSTTLVFSAAFVGSMVTYQSLNKVTKMLFESMKDTYETDLRYSERSIGLQMNFVPQARVDLWVPVLVTIAILLISFILLFLFTRSILQVDKHKFSIKKNKKEIVILPRQTKINKIMFGRVKPISLKFVLISLTRSPGRSLIIPLISFIMSFFIIFMGLLSRTQQEKLDTVYDRIKVTTYMASIRNETRDIGAIDLQSDIYRLIDPEYSYRMLWSRELINDYNENGEYTSLNAEEERAKIVAGSDYVEEMHLYNAINYEYMGISKTNSGEEDEELSQTPEIRIHSNGFGYDWFLNKINQMPKLAYADDVRYTPDFFKDLEPEVEFLEGYSFDSLRLRENIGMISQNFAKTFGVENGDTIRITAWFNNKEVAFCSILDLKVIGIYNKKWQTDTIYIPWIMGYDHNYYIDFNYPTSNENLGQEVWNEMIPRSVRAATFTVKNTEELSKFRDYLDKAGYSQVGKVGSNRRVIVIQDKRLVETIQNLKKHIRLIDTLKPIMLILFGIIGFAVSYIIIRHRMNELAIMRSLGAKKRQVFFSFFLEQLILFFIGLIPTIIYAFIQPNKISIYGLSLVYFIFCYLIGTMLALIIMNKAKVMEILFTKE